MLGAYILIAVDAGTERKVYDLLKAITEIEEVYEVYGEWDMILKVTTKDIKELDKLVSDKIRVVKEIKLTSTMIIAR